MRRGEPVRVSRPSSAPWGGAAIDVAWSCVLAHGNHATASVNSIAEAARHLGRESSAIQVNT